MLRYHGLGGATKEWEARGRVGASKSLPLAKPKPTASFMENKTLTDP